MVKDENYIVMHGWMRNKLGLKGNDLIVYAVLWGFSQDGESEFRGTIDYIMEFSGSGRRTVIRSLQSLEEIGFIKKVERNFKEGKTNGYICVPLEKVGVCQNDTPPVCQNDTPGMPNCHPPCAKMTHPPYIIEEKEINKEINKDSKKESKKEGIKEDKDKFKKLTYDEILSAFAFSEETNTAVGSFLQYSTLNKHFLTNENFYRFLEALKTYPENERPSAVQKVIDNHQFMIRSKPELHFDEMGIESATADQDFNDIINSSIFNFNDRVKLEIWHFIRYRGGIHAKITNDGLHKLCMTLRFSYFNDGDRVKALSDAIEGGYRTIKEPPKPLYDDIGIDEEDELAENFG